MEKETYLVEVNNKGSFTASKEVAEYVKELQIQIKDLLKELADKSNIIRKNNELIKINERLIKYGNKLLLSVEDDHQRLIENHHQLRIDYDNNLFKLQSLQKYIDNNLEGNK